MGYGIYQQYTKYIEESYKTTLANIATLIEKSHPEMHNTETLKRLAGTDWFWGRSRELADIKSAFDLAYIYYLELSDSGYIFLMSADIQKDAHPEWLGGPVWSNTTPVPDFIVEAFETKKIAYSASPTVNEWGTLVSVALPIITDGKIVGILGIDYDISFVNYLNKHAQYVFLIVLVLAVIAVGIQFFVGLKFALNPLKKLAIDERTREMLDTTPLPCVFSDNTAVVIDCNPSVLKLFGVADKETFLRCYYGFAPKFQPDGKNSLQERYLIIQTALEQGYHFTEWMFTTATGEPLPVELTLVRIQWGGSYCTATYIRDLRAIKDSELKLHAAEDDLLRISSIVEGSPNFVLYIDINGNIEYMNPSVFNVSGFTKEEILAEGLKLIFSEEDVRRLQEEYFPYVIEHRHTKFEMNISDRNGSVRVLLFSAFAATLSNGESGVGLTASDITDQKRMQQLLIDANEQAELALRQAEYYSKAKSDFLSRMSHEMRTPLNAIIGVTAIAKTVTDDDRRTECFNKIDTASHELMNNINNILDMAKIEAGDFELSAERFSFPDAIQVVISAIAPLAAEKEQTFATDIDASIPDALITDERRMKQVLLILLSNAVKFTPTKGTISLSAERLNNTGGKLLLRFSVSDNGIGISDELRARLWNAFEQEDNSITRSYGGLGLSLPIVKRIVDMMKGDIQVESKPEKGSRFTVTVPVDESNSDELNTAKLARLRILVVDDVEINREIILMMLEDTGAVLDCAQNGAEAVGMFKQNGYDFILMDLHMPLMDGFEAARRIRAAGDLGSSVPIIAVSADIGSDVVTRCLEAGMNAHIGKPFTYETLIAMMIKQLN